MRLTYVFRFSRVFLTDFLPIGSSKIYHLEAVIKAVVNKKLISGFNSVCILRCANHITFVYLYKTYENTVSLWCVASLSKSESTSRRFYPKTPQVGVGAVIENQGEILLVKRAHEPSKGLWSIPGGLVELGETLRDAAKREMEEETGLVVELEDMIDVMDSIEFDDNRRVKYHFVLVDFLAHPATKETRIRASSEVLDAKWLSPSELSSLPLTRTVTRLLKKIGFLSP